MCNHVDLHGIDFSQEAIDSMRRNIPHQIPAVTLGRLAMALFTIVCGFPVENALPYSARACCRRCGKTHNIVMCMGGKSRMFITKASTTYQGIHKSIRNLVLELITIYLRRRSTLRLEVEKGVRIFN